MAEKFNSMNLRWPSKQILPQKGGEHIAMEFPHMNDLKLMAVKFTIWLSQRISQI